MKKIKIKLFRRKARLPQEEAPAYQKRFDNLMAGYKVSLENEAYLKAKIINLEEQLKKAKADVRAPLDATRTVNITESFMHNGKSYHPIVKNKVYKQIEVSQKEFERIQSLECETIRGSDSWGQDYFIKLCTDKQNSYMID